MKKTILITGATDGIGLATATALVALGHQVVVHGRDAEKLEKTSLQLNSIGAGTEVKTLLADFATIKDVRKLIAEISIEMSGLDVLINNAGVFKAPQTVTSEGLDIRFAVNTIAPYLLTRRLLPLLSAQGRVINLSSAAQAPVDIAALEGKVTLDDMAAYSQSKLALTGWTYQMALERNNSVRQEAWPLFVSVNPGSLLGTKMVREAFGDEGRDVAIGADILTRVALSDEFSDANGGYFDNDTGQFGQPHPDALDADKNSVLCKCLDSILANPI